MIVEVLRDGSVALLEPRDTRGFKLVAPQDFTATDLAQALAGIGDVATDHAWVAAAWVRAASGLAGSAEWEESFGRMLDFARSKNWVRARDEAIRAHIVRR